MNLAETLGHHAGSRPDKPALVFGEQTITYRELAPLVERTANHLVALGLKAGDVAGVSLGDSLDHIVLLFALARSNIVIQPIDWRWNAAEQERVATFFGATLVVVEPGQPRLAGVRSVPFDNAWRASVATQNDSARHEIADGPFLLSLSSGTTGRPKGPLLTHGQFMARFKVFWINLGFNSQDVYVSATPLYYGGGRGFAMLSLYNGATVVLVPLPYQPIDLVTAIDEHQATSIFLVPTLLRRLLSLSDGELAPMQRMRLVLSSGSALHADERRSLRARVCANFIQYYSSSEGGGVSYLTSDEPARFDESVGRPVFSVDVQCVDEKDEPVPIGEVGRIRYRGPAVANGFYRDPEASRDAFREGWYYPGDLGSLDDEGVLYLRGRAKDMIIRGGVNIYPADIEAVLTGHPAVEDAAVVGWPSREFNEEVAAFVVLSGEVTPGELLELCRATLARYKWPKQVFVVDDFPRNALGKVVKPELALRLGMIDTRSAG